MKRDLDVLNQDKLKALVDASKSLEEVVIEFNAIDISIQRRLKEFNDLCGEIMTNNPEKDTDYAIKVIREICSEISTMELIIAPNRPRPGWYAFDGKLLRNVASIVFKMELLAAKYFAESYNRYTYISSANRCNSRDKIYELADEWLSDRRTMMDVVAAMLDEIQSLGITPNPVSQSKPETGDSLLNILSSLLPGK